MALQVLPGAEGLVTDHTGVVLDAQVAAGVVLQAGLGAEVLPALTARPGTLVVVYPHVLH